MSDWRKNKSPATSSSGRPAQHTPSDLRMDRLFTPYPATSVEVTVLRERGYGPKDKEEKIGVGGFGFVVKTTYHGKVVALKRLNKIEAKDENYVKNECYVLQQFKYPNFVQWMDSFSIGANFYLAMEYCDDGSLHELIKRRPKRQYFTEWEGRRIMRGILTGIEKMHSEKFAHRDIKIGNVLLMKDGTVKLADFGLAKQCYPPKEADNSRVSDDPVRMLSEWCGTEVYMAPEILRMKAKPGEKTPYDPFQADMFACGVVMFILMYLRAPVDFRQSNEPKLNLEERKKTYGCLKKRVWAVRKDVLEKLSQSCIDLYSGLLEPNYLRRYSAREALHHEWFYEDAIKQARHERSGSRNMGTATNLSSSGKTISDYSKNRQSDYSKTRQGDTSKTKSKSKSDYSKNKSPSDYSKSRPPSDYNKIKPASDYSKSGGVKKV